MVAAELRWGARVLLVAAFAMVIETACSHAPHNGVSNEPRIVTRERIAMYEGGNVVVLFRTRNQTTFATSGYTTTDSSVVIHRILRDSKYYYPTEAKLYGLADVQPPPKDLVLPMDLRISEIDTMEKWDPRSTGADIATGVLIFGGIVVVAIVAAISAVRHLDWGGN